MHYEENYFTNFRKNIVGRFRKKSQRFKIKIVTAEALDTHSYNRGGGGGNMWPSTGP